MTPASLLTRVLAATEGSRELEYALWQRFTPGATYRVSHIKHAHSDAEWDIHETRDSTGRLVDVPAYTTDLSAAIVLVEHVRPGDFWRIDRRENVRALIVQHNGATTQAFTANAPTAPLAILAALLMSLEEK